MPTFQKSNHLLIAQKLSNCFHNFTSGLYNQKSNRYQFEASDVNKIHFSA